jgi:hypothetical protein
MLYLLGIVARFWQPALRICVFFQVVKYKVAKCAKYDLQQCLKFANKNLVSFKNLS